MGKIVSRVLSNRKVVASQGGYKMLQLDVISGWEVSKVSEIPRLYPRLRYFERYIKSLPNEFKMLFSNVNGFSLLWQNLTLTSKIR